MKLTRWYVAPSTLIAALASMAAAGCSGALLGHVAVMAVAVGIFAGTLSLGRSSSPAVGVKTEVTLAHAEPPSHVLDKTA